MARNFFYCDTPFQVFNTINIVTNRCKGDINSIAIYHQFRGSYEIADRLKKTPVFNNVYDIYPSKNNYTDITRLIFPTYLCKKTIGIVNRTFDSVYFSCLDTSASLALYSSLHYKKSILYEDGTGTYKGDIIYDNMSWKRLYLLRVLHPLVRYFQFSLQYLYAPEMSISKIKVPKEKIEIGDIQLLNWVFDYKRNNIYSRRFVYLDQPYPGENKISLDSRTNNILKKISHNLVIRRHPRMQTTNLVYGIQDSFNNNWELECLHQITDNHILISIYSTSIFQPTIIKGKNPTLVFLFCLYKKIFKDERMEEMRNHVIVFSKSFPQTKVFLPETWDEFQNIISKSSNA